MTFKVGDKVRVREDLEVGKAYDDIKFEEYMQQYKGKTTVITEVWYDCYSLSEDNGEYGWIDEMLEPVEREKNNMNIEKLNEEYKNKMDKLLEEYKDKVKEVTKKEEPFIIEGQEYFTINTCFKIKTYDYDEDSFGRRLLESGNIFPYTDKNREEVRKEVELIAERRKLQSEMEMFARQNNEDEINWNNSKQMKWYLYINYTENDIREGWTFGVRHFNTTYFTSKEIAQKSLEKFGDRIRKLYLKEGEE